LANRERGGGTSIEHAGSGECIGRGGKKEGGSSDLHGVIGRNRFVGLLKPKVISLLLATSCGGGCWCEAATYVIKREK
jgi:hypothetical protein